MAVVTRGAQPLGIKEARTGRRRVQYYIYTGSGSLERSNGAAGRLGTTTGTSHADALLPLCSFDRAHPFIRLT